MRLDWLLDVLRSALAPHGFSVTEAPGARTRGRSFKRAVRWVVDHHTASARTSGNHGSLRVLMYGRPGLSGPLCQVTDGRNGDTIIVACGIANHAGYGTMPDGTNPNQTAVGRESENNGVGEPWPSRQRLSQVIGDAAILRRLGVGAGNARGHKEVDPRRKIDPTYDMDDHRGRVGALLAGPMHPTPSPSEEDDMTPDQERKLNEAHASANQAMVMAARAVEILEGRPDTKDGEERPSGKATGTLLGRVRDAVARIDGNTRPKE